jgi:hypothetical protein
MVSGATLEGRIRMAYGKEDQGDESEFVHFEEGEGIGSEADDLVEETDEELVIAERPDTAPAPPRSPAARKSPAKKSSARRGKKPAAKKTSKKSKPAPKKSAKKKAKKKTAKRGKKR